DGHDAQRRGVVEPGCHPAEGEELLGDHREEQKHHQRTERGADLRADDQPVGQADRCHPFILGRRRGSVRFLARARRRGCHGHRPPYRVPRSAYFATLSTLDLSTKPGPVSTGCPPPSVLAFSTYSLSITIGR